MSDTEIEVASRAPSSSSEPDVALVAGRGAGEPVIEVLESASLTFKPFTDVEALLVGMPHSLPSLIVWRVEDDDSRLAARVASIRQSLPQTPLVIVCSSVNRWGVRAALAAGAAAVLLARDIESALTPCIQAVLAGQTCVPQGHWRQIDPPALSTREKQILGLVVMGYMNSQIAQQLFLAESTVKSHLSSAFGKLGVRSRHDAVHLILDPERGLGMGILGLGGEPIDTSAGSTG